MSRNPLVPAVLFRMATTALDDLGFSSERIVERARLPQYQYLRPEALIPGVHAYRILGQGARASGNSHFGFLCTEHMPLMGTAVFGKMLSACPTLYRTIENLNRRYSNVSNSSRIFKVEGDDEIWWLRKSLLPPTVGSRQMELTFVATMLQVVRLGLGTDWRPARVCVEADSVPNLDRLSALADAEILYNRGVSGFAIPRSVISQSTAFSAPAVQGKKAEFSSDAPSGEFVESLLQVLRSLVRLGHPRIETLAETGNLGVRALQRRLQAEGRSFKSLVDQARFLEARDLLGKKDIKLIEIAHALSYSDQAHFTRAFRRWAGVPPSQYRLHLTSG